MYSINVMHNIEVAHRLMNLPGKCQQIHGHSMLVSLEMFGGLNKHGIFEDLDFGHVKKEFRSYLDTNYDHHLLLNKDDPWARPLLTVMHEDTSGYHFDGDSATLLPGLVTVSGDPTTENLARWIHDWAISTFAVPCCVGISETGTNGASYTTPRGALV